MPDTPSLHRHAEAWLKSGACDRIINEGGRRSPGAVCPRNDPKGYGPHAPVSRPTNDPKETVIEIPGLKATTRGPLVLLAIRHRECFRKYSPGVLFPKVGRLLAGTAKSARQLPAYQAKLVYQRIITARQKRPPTPQKPAVNPSPQRRRNIFHNTCTRNRHSSYPRRHRGCPKPLSPDPGRVFSTR